jgi:predicted DNA-binding protein YlxM (UPF0122 family)
MKVKNIMTGEISKAKFEDQISPEMAKLNNMSTKQLLERVKKEKERIKKYSDKLSILVKELERIKDKERIKKEV